MKRLALYGVAAAMLAGPALADLVIPDLHYRTGPYAAGGIPFSDGYQDYFALLNASEMAALAGEADPGRSECETGYNTEKVAWSATRPLSSEGALIYQPLSTGITYQLIPQSDG